MEEREGVKAEVSPSPHEVWLLQRKAKKITGPGKTTGWIHRATLREYLGVTRL